MSPLSRILLFLVIAFAVIIAGLWISGGKKDEYSAKIQINAYPSQIFPYLIEPDRLKAWMTGLEEIDKPVPPQEGFNSPPELVRTVVDPKGKRVRYNDIVIRYTDNEILTIQSSASGTVQTTAFQLEKVSSGKTQFSYYVRVSHSSLARLIAPLQTSNFQDRINADVRKLKELVEKNEPQLPDDSGEPEDNKDSESEVPDTADEKPGSVEG